MKTCFRRTSIAAACHFAKARTRRRKLMQATFFSNSRDDDRVVMLVLMKGLSILIDAHANLSRKEYLELNVHKAALADEQYRCCIVLYTILPPRRVGI